MASISRVSLQKTSYKVYVVAIAIIFAVFILSFFKPGIVYTQNDTSWAIAFAEVNGTIYALVAAFTILSALNRFNTLQRGLSEESEGLRDVFLMCQSLKQNKISKKLKEDMINYAKTVIQVYWKGKGSDEDATKSFNRIITRIQEFKIRNEKDAVIMESVHDKLSEAGAYGIDAVSALASKTPKILWVLLVELSFVVLLSFWVANVGSQLFATIVMVFPAIAIAFVVAIIYDLDNPLQPGFWVILPTQYMKLESLLRTNN